MNEIIERVARAIAGSAAAAFGDRAVHYVENNWGAYTNQARAAIAALREPTKAMVTAAFDFNAEVRGGKEYACWTVIGGRTIWSEMIDAALKED